MLSIQRRKSVLEGLVAIATVAILAVVLLPIFARAVEKAPARRSWAGPYTSIRYATGVYQSGSGNSWSGLDNVKASDDSRASVEAATAKTVRTKGFGFTIPSNARIDGLTVWYEGYQIDPRNAVGPYDVTTSLRGTSDAQIGNYIYDDVLFNGYLPFPPGSGYTDELAAYGSDTDANTAWGVTSFSPATVNDNDFGAQLTLDFPTPPSHTMYLDSISIKITYYLPI